MKERENPHSPLVTVPPGHHHKRPQIHHAQPSQQQKEVVQLPPVQVIRYPPYPSPSRAQPRHHRHQKRAQIIPERRRRQRQRRAQAPHRVRRLLVEKLQLPHERENLRTPNYKILRRLPQNRHVCISPTPPEPHRLENPR
ncbi:Golgi-body localisation protein domain [Striga asiatica]|uniref:Golgi-body localisation protein domain n=1 Tax=Striga asiatica TaxID=4170 RepID=A0A5A7P5A5_STRAF|nr:Golgi-body localisation protein domain [Striga asiatica]